MFPSHQRHTVDLHVHSETRLLTEILGKLNIIITKESQMAGEIDALKAEVVEFRREVAETVTSAAKAVARIQELVEQIGSGDPAAVAAATAELQVERANLDAAQQALEAAATPPAA